MSSFTSEPPRRVLPGAGTAPGRPSTRSSAAGESAPEGARPGRAIDRRRALLLLAGVAPACSHGDPARTAAERFVDAYYVEIDLPRARDAAVGLARAKVEDQIKLLTGQEVPDAASRPRINYRFLEHDDAARGGDRRGYVFELTITFDGGEQVQRRALVTVRQEPDGWHAANFQEID